MDYMQLVKKSIAGAWRYKFLWFFGFFVTVTDGYAGFHFWDEKIEKISRFERFGRFGDWHWDFDPALLIALALLAFSLYIIFWVINVISEGSLIHGVSRKEMKLDTNFSDCWSAGMKNFLRLLGIILLITLLTLFLIFGFIILIVPAYILSVPLGVLLTILLLPVIIVLVIMAISVEGWAIRYAVLENDPWLEAIKKGWYLFKNNIWKTIAIALLSFFTQLVLWCFLLVGMIILAMPFIIMAFANLWLGLLPGIMVTLTVMIISSAYFGTFASSIWTLAFGDLTKTFGSQSPATV